jgi:hypothetical protein
MWAGRARARFAPDMPKVKLDAVNEGMVVTADVKNMDEMLLIPAGCELTARHIKILRTWGISEIQVDGAESDSTTLLKIAPEILQRLEAELKKIFWEFDPDNAAQREIFKLALRRRARNALNQVGHAAIH